LRVSPDHRPASEHAFADSVFSVLSTCSGPLMLSIRANIIYGLIALVPLAILALVAY
jgi:hypothetical protein